MWKLLSAVLLGVTVVLFANVQPVLSENAGDTDPPDSSGFFYTIKKGDTLWDLSEKFYRSPWHWPGLWEMNKKIKNPHWIYPGKRIRVFYKETLSMENKPVHEKFKDPIEPPKRAEGKSRPAGKIVPSYYYPNMDSIGFIRKHAVPELGKILRSPHDEILIGKDDTVYIEPSGEGALLPGQKYHVFETEKIARKYDNKVFEGVKHIITGTVRVTAHKDSYVRAVVVKSYKDINVGDNIMAYTPREKALPVEERPGRINARLLGTDSNQIYIGSHTTAYIDMGKKDNIKPGQIYTIYREQKPNQSFYEEKLVKPEGFKTGKLIVLHTEEIASTVEILSCSDRTSAGYLVH